MVMVSPQKWIGSGINVKTGFDVKNSGVKKDYKQRHNGDKANRHPLDPVFRLFQALFVCFLVHHEK
jgi:hypothetical protein